jgi:hypothetical protein
MLVWYYFWYMKRILIHALVFCVFVITPVLVGAEEPTGIVPCDGPDCGTCEFVELGNNILRFFITLAVAVAGLMFAWGGFTMVTSAGESGKVSEARGMMTSSVVGLVIVLSAWIFMDTLLKMVLRDDVSQLGMWNKIECSGQVGPTQSAVSSSVPGGGRSTMSASDINNRVMGTSEYKDELCALAVDNGIGDQCATLQALMAKESGGNVNASGGAGESGLMQLMPGTARELDPALRNLSDAQIRERLKDPEYNMQLGVQNYANMHRQFNGDTALTLAAYNGGPGANDPSQNCDGLRRWQCEWDNDEHTDRNEGYEVTRNYVLDISAMADAIESES